jgi:signal transduction histidine kinase
MGVFGIWIAVLVFFADKHCRLNQGFAFMVLSIIFWISFYQFASVSDRNELSLILFRGAAGSVFVFFIFYYFFVIRWFLRQKGFYKILGNFVVIYGVLFCTIVILTNKIIMAVKFEDGVIIPIFSLWGWVIFYGYVLVLTALINAKLLLSYFFSSSKEKIKIKYFLVGLLIFASLNLIFNVILPTFFGVYRLYQIGNYSLIFLLSFTAYAVVKQNLFGVKTVLSVLLVISLIILYITDVITLTTEFSPIVIILKSSVLITFIGLGFFLIKSVKKEITQREEIEQIADNLKRANTKLKKLNQEKSDFLSFATHQLRTPLSGIKGYAGMVLQGTYGKISGQLKKTTKLLLASSERLLLLIEDFLDISRIELGQMKFIWKESDLTKLTKGVIQELKNKVDDRRVKLIFSASFFC